MRKVQITFTGTRPLLMKRWDGGYLEAKSRSDNEETREPQDEAKKGLYLNADGIFVPSSWILACFRDGGTFVKENRRSLGKWARAAVVISPFEIPLLHKDGKPYGHMGYQVDFAKGRIGGMARTQVRIIRPRFDEWSLKFEVTYHPEMLSDKAFENVLQYMQYCGIGDYRPSYGQFNCEIARA